MKSYSQSNQDRFAMLVNNQEPGFFLDIGCSVPDWQSNSKALLQLGWKGICIDRQDHTREWNIYDGVQFICADARKLDLSAHIPKTSGHKWDVPVDYLSLDVDSCSLEALDNLLAFGISFKCATIEHDSYRFGSAMRDAQRAIMKSAEYVLVKKDVEGSGLPYEDWYIHPMLQGVGVSLEGAIAIL